jgi:hypothetical protein
VEVDVAKTLDDESVATSRIVSCLSYLITCLDAIIKYLPKTESSLGSPLSLNLDFISKDTLNPEDKAKFPGSVI